MNFLDLKRKKYIIKINWRFKFKFYFSFIFSSLFNLFPSSYPRQISRETNIVKRIAKGEKKTKWIMNIKESFEVWTDKEWTNNLNPNLCFLVQFCILIWIFIFYYLKINNFHKPFSIFLAYCCFLKKTLKGSHGWILKDQTIWLGFWHWWWKRVGGRSKACDIREMNTRNLWGVNG